MIWEMITNLFQSFQFSPGNWVNVLLVMAFYITYVLVIFKQPKLFHCSISFFNFLWELELWRIYKKFYYSLHETCFGKRIFLEAIISWKRVLVIVNFVKIRIYFRFSLDKTRYIRTFQFIVNLNWFGLFEAIKTNYMIMISVFEISFDVLF